MLGTPANLIQQAERFTQQYDDNQVLRLRNGKVVAGEFKGTGLQKFKGMLVKLFWPPTSWKREYLASRQANFEDVSKQEEQAFANALTGAISKRTTRPYQVTSGKIQDIKRLLETSQADRNEFDRIVATVTDAVTHPSPVINDPLDGAKKAADMAVENEQLCRVAQMQQLRSDVTELLSQAGIKKAVIKQLDNALDDKTVKLALYNAACDYARRLYSPPTSWSHSSAVAAHESQHETESSPKTPTKEQEQDWNRKHGMTDSDRQNSFKFKSPTELAADQMFEQGDDTINPDEIPEGNHKARKIKQLRKIKEPWAQQAIELLQTDSPEDAKKATLLERANLRSKDYAKAQRDKAKAVHQTQTAYWSRAQLNAMKKVEKLEEQGIKDNSHFPQEYRDLAAQRISRPLYYDNVQLPMEEAIDQTISMLKNAYPTLADKGNAFREQELRERLQRFLTNRQVEPAEVPATFSSSSQTDKPEEQLSKPEYSVSNESTHFKKDECDSDGVSEERATGMETDNDLFSKPPASPEQPSGKASASSGFSSWHSTEPPPLDDEEP